MRNFDLTADNPGEEARIALAKQLRLTSASAESAAASLMRLSTAAKDVTLRLRRAAKVASDGREVKP